MEDTIHSELADLGKIIAGEDIRVSLGDIIGWGQYGCVYQGTLFPSLGEHDQVRVAVKTVRNHNGINHRGIELLIKEACVMKDFDHPNVINLLGVCIKDELPLVIIPLMENGSLLEYLRTPRIEVTNRDLIILGLQIARGMEYLSLHKFVHRDLAARNCMLDSSYQVKIGDFGLGRDIYEAGEYVDTGKHNDPVPFKWTAPEYFIDHIFTTKSDVWSYGVVLWECMTRGDIPYSNIRNNHIIIGRLTEGYRLPKPSKCPEEVYHVMMTCWAWQADERPTFTQIIHELEKVLSSTIAILPSTENGGEIGNKQC